MTPQEQYQKDVAQFLRRKQLFESLLETPGWKELVHIAEVWRSNYIANLIRLAPAERDGILATQEDNYHKGIVFAIDMFLGTPSATIRDADALLNRQKQEPSNAQRFNLDPERRERKQPDFFDDDGERLGPDAVVTDLSGSNE